MATLLEDIDAFLAAHGMGEIQFGLLAVKDKHLVPDLRGVQRSAGPNSPPKNANGPRELRSDTAQRVKEFMLTYRPEKAAA